MHWLKKYIQSTPERLKTSWIVDPAQCLPDEKSVKEVMALLLSSHIITHQIKDWLQI